MDYQRAHEFVKAITGIAGCVSAIQMLDDGGFSHLGSRGNELRMQQRVDYCETLKRHQKKLKDLLTK